MRELDEGVSGNLFPERWKFSPEYTEALRPLEDHRRLGLCIPRALAEPLLAGPPGGIHELDIGVAHYDPARLSDPVSFHQERREDTADLC